ncbi:MAG: Gfo/Idh/MocA family oxidoreductase [Caldilineaceae bacterium]
METQYASPVVRTALIGSGRYAQFLLRSILSDKSTSIRVICEPSPATYEQACAIFREQGVTPPPNQPDFDKLLADYAGQLDCAFILTPHAYHFAQATACLQAGLDVLLQKPMVVNAQEAQGLIDVRDRTGKLLVVAFPGSLSPQIRTAVQMLRSGQLGSILSITAVVYEEWRKFNTGTWRQIPEIAGGGFFFDAGAHMLNTVCDLAGEDFQQVAAWLDKRGLAVDIMGVVMGKLRSGALVTLNGCGETATSYASDLRVICTGGVLHANIWGTYLALQKPGERTATPIEVPASMGVWEQFLAVRRGAIANPCPAEVGLRMARLWDAIQSSSAQDGAVVKL